MNRYRIILVIVCAIVYALALAACEESGRQSGSDGGPSADLDAGQSNGDGASKTDGTGDNGSQADLEPDTGCADGFGGLPISANPPIAGSWTLTFQDDFIDDVMDDAKWKVGQEWAGFNGISANDPDNIDISCGYLSFIAEKRPVNFAGKDHDYVSGEVTGFKRFRQKYGYFEARIKYDAIQGLWPAFWLMPDRGNYGNGDNNRMSYLKFDLKGEARTSVTKALLKLHVDSADSGVQNVVLMRVQDDGWSENSMTWNSRPVVDPLWIEMTYDPQWISGDTASFDVTDYVNQQLAGDEVVSFALFDGFTRTKRVSFSSKEGAHPPYLELAGDPATVKVTEDTWVGQGSFIDQNMGAEDKLHVQEDWGSTTSTYEGGMEVDIMESLGIWGDNMTSHAFHWDGYGSDHKSEGSGHVQFPATSDGFHVYGLNWQPGLLEFYVDGQQTFSWSNSRVGSVDAFILLSLQMGGWQDNYGNNGQPDDAALPGKMVIDYVRVWSGP